MLSNLQILRAFAALNVVCFHIFETASSYHYNTEYLTVFKGWGANGVDLFFVISGFVMLYTQLERKRSMTTFFKARIIRIIPLYWLLTSIIIFIYLIAPSAFRKTEITLDWALSSYTFLTGMLSHTNPILYVGWTLEWEILFYAIFGLSLNFKKWNQAICFIFTCIILLALFASNYRILEFLGGILVAIAYKRFSISHYLGSFIFGVGLFLLFLSLSPMVCDAIRLTVLLWGVPSVFIVYGLVTAKQINSRVGELLGHASYSIYLTQVLAIPIFYKLISKLELSISNDILAICCLVITVSGGVIMYFTVEKPMTLYLKHKYG